MQYASFNAAIKKLNTDTCMTFMFSLNITLLGRVSLDGFFNFIKCFEQANLGQNKYCSNISNLVLTCVKTCEEDMYSHSYDITYMYNNSWLPSYHMAWQTWQTHGWFCECFIFFNHFVWQKTKEDITVWELHWNLCSNW